MWSHRNSVYHGEEKASSRALINKLKAEIKLRIRADFARLKEEKFKKHWGKIVTIEGENITLTW